MIPDYILEEHTRKHVKTLTYRKKFSDDIAMVQIFNNGILTSFVLVMGDLEYEESYTSDGDLMHSYWWNYKTDVNCKLEYLRVREVEFNYYL